MFPLGKGEYSKQAHVALPEGTFEDEHGREGFYGRVSHLYHQHPPTAWTRIETLSAFDEKRIRRFIEAYRGIDHHTR